MANLVFTLLPHFSCTSGVFWTNYNAAHDSVVPVLSNKVLPHTSTRKESSELAYITGKNNDSLVEQRQEALEVHNQAIQMSLT
jgi:hypothetical protein